VIKIDNGVNVINYTVNAGLTASFVKGGTGEITFVQGAGRTLISSNGLIWDMPINSRATIASFGTVDYLYIDKAISTIYPAPYIDVVVPDSTLPSTTGNFELYGSFFKEDMTVVFDGQTVNYVIFHSSNWLTVNVTTGATEGLFSITLDNGLSKTFTNAYMVVLGTVFTPLTAEWTLTEPIDVDNDKVLVETWGSYGTAVWSKVFDYTKNISVRFNFTVSPLGIIGVWNATFYPHLALKNVSDNIKRFELSYSSEATSVRLRHKSLLVSPEIILYQSTEGTVLGNAQIIANKVIEYRFVDGIMYLYINNVLTYTYADVITENLKLEIYINKHDVKNIKYIELA
jgi:hypothetical protein